VQTLLNKQSSKQGIDKAKQQGKKNNWNNKHLSILTLNVNSLNSPIKRQRIANWIKNQDPTICCLQETHLTEKSKPGLE
jgi:hypothetical protein